jgi:hypothetical protein
MRRVLVALAVVLAVLAAGCTGDASTVKPASAAPPQEAQVGWVEPTSGQPLRLVFEVRRIEVLDDGWRADVAIRNDSGVAWAIGDPDVSPTLPFGVMLFATGDLDELERRNREGTLPGMREAHTVTPTPPAELQPGDAWEGSISAPGALAAGRWLRVVFGPLTASGDPPKELPSPLVWISDNAYELRG